MSKPHAVAAGVFVLGVVCAVPTIAQNYVDPRLDARGYAAWCSRMGGTVYNNASGYGCNAPGRTGNAYSPGGAIGGTMAPATNALGNAIGQVIVGALVGRGAQTASRPSTPAEDAEELQELQQLEQPAASTAAVPFDTANASSSTNSATDQLCQAAGSGSGCVRQPAPHGAALTAKASASGRTVVAAAAVGTGSVPPHNQAPVCDAKIDLRRPVALSGIPGWAPGSPVASSLDDLQPLDYSDIKSNLVTMSPDQLVKLKLAAQQQETRLKATIDGLKVKLFPAVVSATSPVRSLGDFAKAAALETAKDELPFWRQVERIAQHRTTSSAAKPIAEEYETIAAYLDQIDKSGEYLRTVADYIDRVDSADKAPPPQPPGFGALEWAYGRSLVEGILAADSASKGDKGAAYQHGANAAQALLPAAEWLLPEEKLRLLVKSEAALTVSLIAVDLAAHGYEIGKERSVALDAKSGNTNLAIELTTRIANLEGKLRADQNLQKLIAEQLHCG